MLAYVSGILGLARCQGSCQCECAIVLDRPTGHYVPGSGVHKERVGRQVDRSTGRQNVKSPTIHRHDYQGLGHWEACAASGMGLSYALRLVSKWRRGSVRLRWTLANLENLRPVSIQFGNKYQCAFRNVAWASLSQTYLYCRQTDVSSTLVRVVASRYCTMLLWAHRHRRHKKFLCTGLESLTRTRRMSGVHSAKRNLTKQRPFARECGPCLQTCSSFLGTRLRPCGHNHNACAFRCGSAK